VSLFNPTYEKAGVTSSTEAQSALIKKLIPTQDFNNFKPLIKKGYFANVLDIGPIGLAFCTDGVGTKMLVAEMMDQYDTIGIDCVAMNVNDMICVGATPISMVDYVACNVADTRIFEELGTGLAIGAEQAGINICGGEVAQIREIINGFDLIGSAVGIVEKDKINTGKTIEPGDLIVGMGSSGVHANGLTLARKALLGETIEEQKQKISQYEESLKRTIGEELLEPTRIYVKPILEMLQSGIELKAMVQITSSGFGNLNRVEKDKIQFVIDDLPDIPPIFKLIQERGHIENDEMFQVFNMGIGFCVIAEHANDVSKIIEICRKHEIPAQRIGYVEEATDKLARIKQFNVDIKTNKGA